MTDISLCRARACVLRGRCYRYLAVPDARLVSMIKPDNIGYDCALYVPLMNTDQLLTIEEVDAEGAIP